MCVQHQLNRVNHADTCSPNECMLRALFSKEASVQSRHCGIAAMSGRGKAFTVLTSILTSSTLFHLSTEPGIRSDFLIKLRQRSATRSNWLRSDDEVPCKWDTVRACNAMYTHTNTMCSIFARKAPFSHQWCGTINTILLRMVIRVFGCVSLHVHLNRKWEAIERHGKNACFIYLPHIYDCHLLS